MTRHYAGQATYPGDVTGRIVGRVMGPTTFGTWVIATDAAHDGRVDRTTVTFRTFDKSETVRRDMFGQLWAVEAAA